MFFKAINFVGCSFLNNHDLKIIVIEQLRFRNRSFYSECTYKWNLGCRHT